MLVGSLQIVCELLLQSLPAHFPGWEAHYTTRRKASRTSLCSRHFPTFPNLIWLRTFFKRYLAGQYLEEQDVLCPASSKSKSHLWFSPQIVAPRDWRAGGREKPGSFSVLLFPTSPVALFYGSWSWRDNSSLCGFTSLQAAPALGLS